MRESASHVRIQIHPQRPPQLARTATTPHLIEYLLRACPSLVAPTSLRRVRTPPTDSVQFCCLPRNVTSVQDRGGLFASSYPWAPIDLCVPENSLEDDFHDITRAHPTTRNFRDVYAPDKWLRRPRRLASRCGAWPALSTLAACPTRAPAAARPMPYLVPRSSPRAPASAGRMP